MSNPEFLLALEQIKQELAAVMVQHIFQLLEPQLIVLVNLWGLRATILQTNLLKVLKETIDLAVAVMIRCESVQIHRRLRLEEMAQRALEFVRRGDYGAEVSTEANLLALDPN